MVRSGSVHTWSEHPPRPLPTSKPQHRLHPSYEKLNGGHSSLAWMVGQGCTHGWTPNRPLPVPTSVYPSSLFPQVMTGCEDLRVYKQKPGEDGWFLGEVAKERFHGEQPVFEAGLAYYNSSTAIEHDAMW